MTRLLALLYLLCLYFAGQASPHAYAFAVCAPLVGFLAFAAALHHLTRSEVDHE